MKKIFTIIIWIIIASFFMVSCEYNEHVPSNEIPSNVSYSIDVMPIFNASCNTAGCHERGAIPPDLSPANGYNYLLFSGMVDTIFAEESILYKSMIDVKNPMPTTGLLSAYETNFILGWIQQGAKNN